jgi:D-galactarolactone cycloisomerase
MKITKITSHIVRVPINDGSSGDEDREGWAIKEVLTANHVLVKVETDDGLFGWGDGFALRGEAAVKALVDDILAPSLIGKDASDIRSLNNDMQHANHLWGRYGAIMFAISAIDIALWDLAGKRAGLPLCQLLGGSAGPLNAYASLIRYGNKETAVKVALQAVSEGFKAIKLHEIDETVIRAVRKAIGPEITLINDANCPWGAEKAIQKVKKLRDLNLLWYEEPVYPPEDYTSIARVKNETGVPIAAGELVPSFYEFKRLFDAGSVTYAQPSVTKIGGVTEFLQVATLARVYNVELMPHSPYFGPGFLATQHLMRAICPDSLLEWLYFPSLKADMYQNQSRPLDGKVQVSQAPGLGLDTPNLFNQS